VSFLCEREGRVVIVEIISTFQNHGTERLILLSATQRYFYKRETMTVYLRVFRPNIAFYNIISLKKCYNFLAIPYYEAPYSSWPLIFQSFSELYLLSEFQSAYRGKPVIARVEHAIAANITIITTFPYRLPLCFTPSGLLHSLLSQSRRVNINSECQIFTLL
jgi:hypothetical protein